MEQQQQKASRILLMQQVNTFLSQCGLAQYYDIFIEEGFDRLESLMEITETDLIQMEVKRGHRRLLQRAIANAKGIPSTVPLNIAPVIKPSSNPSDNSISSSHHDVTEYNNNSNNMQPSEAVDVSIHLLNNGSNISPLSSTTTNSSHSPVQPQATHEYFPSAGTMTHSAASGMSSTEEEAVTSDNVHRLWKRKYHRHAKPDTNAPLKPPSAYVMFSNDVRAELKQQNKSFTDLAKIIGDRWKNISPEGKELYESNAMKSREEYLKKLEEYHKTDEYKKYQQYLTDFKAENEAAARPVGRPRKRHRKDEYCTSDGTVSDSVPNNAATVRVIPLNTSHSRNNSITETTPTSATTTRHYPFYLLNEESSQQQQQQQQHQK